MSRKARRLARCGRCRAPIKWFWWHGHWRTFEPTPVDPLHHAGPPAYPVEGRSAWSHRALIEELMGRLQQSEDDARDDTYAMPWHVPHTCPPPTQEESPRP